MTVDETQQPCQHALRPHHLSTCIVFMLIFPSKTAVKISSRYLLHVLRVLLNEVAEMNEPMSFKEFLSELANEREAPGLPEGVKLVEKVQHVAAKLNSVDMVTEFFQDLPCLVTDDDDNPPFTPKSLFGHHCRRCCVSFNKLSFLGTMKFVDDFQAWIKGDKSAGYEKHRKDAIRDDNYVIRLQLDREPYAEPEAFGEFEKAQAVGDQQAATESLRKFFEQRFGETTDSEMRQHAMLNLVRMHISNGQNEPAKKLLREAITVARTAGDNVVLLQCMSLLRRLEGRTYSRREPLNELQNNIPALEVLYDVVKLLREAQPLSDCFERIVEAMSVFGLSRDTRGGPPLYSEQFAFHSVQGYIWRLAGCEKLAEIEENIVLAFTESGGNDDMRLKTVAYRAQSYARAGNEEECFKLLLDPETWKGLEHNANQLHCWALEVWYNMLLLASRRGQQRQTKEFLLPHRPGPVELKPFFFEPISKTKERRNWRDPDPYSVGGLNVEVEEDPRLEANIEEHLYSVLRLRKVDHSINALDHLLKALWQSEYQGRFRLYRLSMVLLADLGLELGMTLRSRKLAEEIMPQIVNGDDLELRGFACFVLARCIIATAKRDPNVLLTTLPYLQLAEQDYRTIQVPSAVQDVLYITSVLYNTLANIAASSIPPNVALKTEYENERNKAADRHGQSIEEGRKLEAVNVNEGWEEIWRTVSKVATKAGSRRLFYEKE